MASLTGSTSVPPNGSKGAARFDPDFTKNVVDSMGPKTTPRMREIMSVLIPKLHDFAREVELTVDEWMEGVQLLNWAGQMSTDKRNEGQLVCDVVGLESLVDEITYKKASEASDLATQSAILGPFFRTDHPVREKGASIILTKAKDADDVYMYGRVMDAVSGKPLAGATVDVWQASTNGKYWKSNSLNHLSDIRAQVCTNNKTKTKKSTTYEANSSQTTTANTPSIASDLHPTPCHSTDQPASS